MSDKYEPDPSVSEDVQALIQGAGGDTNPPVSPHENLEADQDLSGLPDNVAEDVRTAARGGA